MKYRLLKSSLFLFFLVLTKNVEAQQSKSFNESTIYEGIEFKMPVVKTTLFPDYKVNIFDFGATQGGLVKNTKAFASAIENAHSKGGGTVIVPRGIWLTGPIVLKSNINLHLEDGALILFSKDFNDYPLIESNFEGLSTVRCISPISAYGAENIAITGNGIIDGSGDVWRPVKIGKMTNAQWDKTVKSGGVLSDDKKMWFPSEGAKKGYNNSSKADFPKSKNDPELIAMKDFLRPVLLSIIKCKRILLDGPTFQNSPSWNVHPLMSEDVIIRNCSIKNPWYSQNGDGLDLESCKNALVYNNTFDVGDDAICFKSGKNEAGRKQGMPTENVIVKNNIVYHGHGGFVIGSEMSGGVRNVHVSDCTFLGTDIGLRFKSTRGRGGIIENIFISNIDMIHIPAEAISFNLFYGGASPILEEGDKPVEIRDEKIVPVSEETPSFRNIFMKNIHVADSETAAFFMGLPEMNLKNVSLENAVFETKKGITTIDTDGLILKNVKVITSDDYALTVYNSKNVKISNFMFDQSKSKVKILGAKTDNIQLDKKDFTNLETQVLKGKELSKKAVIVK